MGNKIRKGCIEYFQIYLSVNVKDSGNGIFNKVFYILDIFILNDICCRIIETLQKNISETESSVQWGVCVCVGGYL